MPRYQILHPGEGSHRDAGLLAIADDAAHLGRRRGRDRQENEVHVEPGHQPRDVLTIAEHPDPANVMAFLVARIIYESDGKEPIGAISKKIPHEHFPGPTGPDHESLLVTGIVELMLL